MNETEPKSILWLFQQLATKSLAELTTEFGSNRKLTIPAYDPAGNMLPFNTPVKQKAPRKKHPLISIYRDARKYLKARSNYPVEIIDDALPPDFQGEAGGYFTKTNKRVTNAKAYKAAGGRCIYRQSTKRIVVGKQWLTHQQQNIYNLWLKTLATEQTRLRQP